MEEESTTGQAAVMAGRERQGRIIFCFPLRGLKAKTLGL
jgi:hypothetical protein